ncbi:MAG: beta-lactamase family protein [Planctomycetes bacterium]|nr:beta-lactamase family protein [Planctomycetota bacterium]
MSIVLVVDNHAETLHLGHADGKQGPAPTGATIYRLGSVTKNFTALTFLLLESRDLCNLSDSVEKYVPEFASIPSPPPSGAKVTLIQLATHTGGLARDPKNADDLQRGPLAAWREVLSRAVPKSSYVADPGSVFAYSNLGYAFLGAALEKVAGVPFHACVTEHVLKPLGMGDTVFELTAEQRTRLAPGFTIASTGTDTSESTAEVDGRGYRVPAGGLFTTLDDMQRWLRYQMGGPAPEGSDLAELPARQRRITVSGPDLDWSYGIGVQSRRFGEVVVFGHSGGVPGYQAEMYFDPERKVGIVILRSAVFGDFQVDKIVAAAFVGAR